MKQSLSPPSPLILSVADGHWQLAGLPGATIRRRLQRWIHRILRGGQRQGSDPAPRVRKPRAIQLEFEWDPSQSIPVTGGPVTGGPVTGGPVAGVPVTVGRGQSMRRSISHHSRTLSD